jgi:hypothetical protein
MWQQIWNLRVREVRKTRQEKRQEKRGKKSAERKKAGASRPF